MFSDFRLGQQTTMRMLLMLLIMFSFIRNISCHGAQMSNHRDQAISTTHPEDGTGELSLTSAFQMDSSNNNVK